MKTVFIGILTVILLIPLLSTSASSYSIFYYHNDHLGSPSVVTASGGNPVWQADYKPFGEVFTEEGEGDFKYNSKELDSTGLYYYGARYYDAGVGRFITTDPLEGSIENPQSLNKYVYTMNNPLKFTDPTGEQAQCGDPNFIGPCQEEVPEKPPKPERPDEDIVPITDIITSGIDLPEESIRVISYEEYFYAFIAPHIPITGQIGEWREWLSIEHPDLYRFISENIGTIITLAGGMRSVKPSKVSVASSLEEKIELINRAGNPKVLREFAEKIGLTTRPGKGDDIIISTPEGRYLTKVPNKSSEAWGHKFDNAKGAIKRWLRGQPE